MNRQLPQTQNKTFVYSYDGTNIVAQEVTNGTSLDYEYFFYDASGSPVGMNYLGNNYLFKKNLQGDIIEIWGTADGSSRSDFRKLVTYTYDAWGNITSMVDTTDNWYRVGTANPFRYRGYYYDNESGLYYLQSRYYDPKVGRFINADEATYLGASGTVLGCNLFAYCENNHVTNIDPDGHFVITTTMLICAGIGALILGTVGGFAGYHLSKKWNVPKGNRWKYVLGGVVIGAVVGALIGGAVGYVIGPSTSSGIVLWSGNGNASVFQAASSFAQKNGLKVLEKTLRGRILNFMQNAANKLLGKNMAWKFMKPLWQASSQQFAKTGKGVVHVFLNASGINFESTFLTIEYWILRDLGVQMVFHLID